MHTCISNSNSPRPIDTDYIGFVFIASRSNSYCQMARIIYIIMNGFCKK